jgi:hypothetical protein
MEKKYKVYFIGILICFLLLKNYLILNFSVENTISGILNICAADAPEDQATMMPKDDRFFPYPIEVIYTGSIIFHVVTNYQLSYFDIRQLIISRDWDALVDRVRTVIYILTRGIFSTMFFILCCKFIASFTVFTLAPFKDTTQLDECSTASEQLLVLVILGIVTVDLTLTKFRRALPKFFGDVKVVKKKNIFETFQEGLDRFRVSLRRLVTRAFFVFWYLNSQVPIEKSWSMFFVLFILLVADSDNEEDMLYKLVKWTEMWFLITLIPWVCLAISCWFL